MTTNSTTTSILRSRTASSSSSTRRRLPRRQKSFSETFHLTRRCIVGVVILTVGCSDRTGHRNHQPQQQRNISSGDSSVGSSQQPLQQPTHHFFVEGLELFGGLYRTASTTNDEIIQGLLGLSSDLGEMRATDSIHEKQDLYMNGRDPGSNRTYPMHDVNFWAPMTLSTLSLYLTAEMKDDPIFNLYLYAFDRIGMQQQQQDQYQHQQHGDSELRIDDSNNMNHSTTTTTTTIYDTNDDVMFLHDGEPPSQGATTPSTLKDDRDEYSDLERTRGEMGYFGGYPVEEYAHTLVMNALSRTDATITSGEEEDDNTTGNTKSSSSISLHSTLPAEDLILTTMVWMAVAHELHEAVRLCGDEHNGTQSVAALDRAVTLWFGSASSNISDDEGRMTTLYDLSQSAGSRFRRYDDRGVIQETKPWVNQELLQRWKGIQEMLLTSPRKCSMDDPFIPQLREEVYKSMNFMTIPLIQNLILSVLDNANSTSSVSAVKFFDLYYSLVIPQIMTCDPNLARELYVPYSIDTTDDTEKQQWIHILERTYSCFRITCRDIGIFRHDMQRCHDSTNKTNKNVSISFAGYVVATDPDFAQTMSYIDRDILQLSIFLKHGSFSSVREWYSYGYNSIHSLRTLASGNAFPAPSNINTKVSQFGLYKAYYDDNPTFADVQIKTALNFEGEFQSASVETIEAVVLGLIRFEVMYLAVATALQYAVEQCELEESTSAKESWDIGVAFLVGSLEGSKKGGRIGGQLLYGVSRELCSHFGTCNNSSSSSVGADSIANAKLISALNSAKLKLATDSCRDVHLLLEDTILPSLRIPLIQGTILYGSRLYGLDTNHSATEDKNVDAYIGFAHATSRSVLPVIAHGDEQSAHAINDLLRYRANETYDNDDAIVTIMNSFRSALPSTSVYCRDIGKLSTVREDLCPDVGALGGHTASTTTNYSDIALDVVEMKEALEAGNRAVAENIYKNGKNCFGAISSGNVSSVISLRSLSVNATTEMLDEPLFMKFLYSNTNRTDGMEARAFADAYVSATFHNMSTSSRTVPAEAAVILNVWMYIAHLVTRTLTACTSTFFDVDENQKSLDIASAFWVGDADLGNPAKSGNLLYGFAHDIAKNFFLTGGNSLHGNESFLTLVDTAKAIIKEIGPACPDAGYIRLRRTVHAMFAQMTIPLVQGLIHSLLKNDQERVRLFATSVIPMLVVCWPDDYQFLSAKLLENGVKAIETEEILVVLYRSLPCLGVSCDDIGTHYTQDSRHGSDLTLCHVAASSEAQHAGYHPGAAFHQYSYLDLDLREMDILMKMGSFETAEDIYIFGKHTNTSLKKLASSLSRRHASHHMAYSRYFNSDSYADTLVGSAIAGVEGPRSFTYLQRQILALRFSQTLVLGHGALDIIFASIADCYDDQNSSQIEAESFRTVEINWNAWDEAAGLLIGSISRNATDLSEDHDNNWYTPFDLAQRECVRFGTCIKGEIGFINRRMIELLYAGRAAATMESCSGLRKIGDDMQSLLLVPVIQATLSAAQAVSHGKHTPLDTAELFVFSEAVLPLIADISNETAASLRRLFSAAATKNDPSLLRTTFAELSPFYDELNVACNLIGSLEGIDGCDDPETYSRDSAESLSNWAVSIITLSCLLVAAVGMHLFVVWRRKSRSQKMERRVHASSLIPDETDGLGNDDSSSSSHYSYNDVDERSTKHPLNDVGVAFPVTSVSSVIAKAFSTDSDKSPSSAQSFHSVDQILQSFSKKSVPMSRQAKKATSRIDRYGDDLPFADEEFGV